MAAEKKNSRSLELKDIQDLLKAVIKSGATELDLEQDGYHITIKAQQGNTTYLTPSVMPMAPPASQQATAPPVAPPAAGAPAQASSQEASYITIKSPMIGTFYRSSSPDKPSFVSVGDEIQKGSVLCIIEAMKLFNEIESEHSGRIVKILVENASPVEYDQPLFLVEPGS